MADPVPGPPAGKIFPRNLTARADHVVRGNPAGTRPESGVDNCYPGLEFDQRNLDKAFFPGLTFEFHRPDGAVLRHVAATGVAAERGLTDADLPLHLWAASKPDVVTSADGQVPYVNFQRRDRTSVPPPADLATEVGRRELELDYPEMLPAWNDLAVVLDGRETGGGAPPPPPEPATDELTRDEVLAELNYLATVEHALSMEYLFAHYSLDAPRLLPDDADEHTRRVHAAATEVFSIAVDEMRHLRWVNEALTLLGLPPNVGRAERIHRQLDRPFQLQPLTPAQLDWFIEVERPSQGTASGIDGMYVRLLRTIDGRPDLFPERDRLVHLVKLIIDEGGEHFRRFGTVKNHLAGLAPESYLRTMRPDPVDALTGGLADLSDQNYALLLSALQATFALGGRAGGQLLEQARRAMFSLHETNHLLAARGVQPRFALPGPVTLPIPVADHAAGLRRAQETVAELGGSAERRLVLQHGAAHEALLAELLTAGTAPASATASATDGEPGGSRTEE
ncbi:ferritin-like domain-containing protein [Frankia sp. CcWB3]